MRSAARRYATMSAPASAAHPLRLAVAALLPHRLALIALTLFVVAGIVSSDIGISVNGPYQRYLGIANIAYVLGDVSLFPDDHNKFYGAAFEAPLVLVERALRLEDSRDIFLSRHLLTHLFFLTGGLFAYLLAHRLFDNKLIALFAMLLFLLHPRLYSASFSNSKDLPFLSMFMIALFLTHRTLKKDTLGAFALLGASAGILANIRIIGFVLLAGVLALQALRLFSASGCARKRILLNGGVFAFAACLTVYASLPYLWADPAPRVVEYWTTLSQHPQDVTELFRGEAISSQSPPADYIPTWFAITTPSFALLLGSVGSFALLLRVVALRTRIFRDPKIRFELLLAGSIAVPLSAIALLSPTVYGAWRQMYFLWAPFSLLAVFGAQWILQSLPQTRLRTLAYGAAGAGIGATLITMAILHPFHGRHFNFLVDRTTPELLKTQYRTNTWGGVSSAVKRLLDLRPASQISVAYDFGSAMTRIILPETDRSRLIIANRANAEFSIERVAGEVSEDTLYEAKVYNNTLWAVVEQEPGENPYAAVYGAAVSSEPIARSEYDIYLNRADHSLIYVKEPCASPVTRDEFFLLVFPEDATVLSGIERESGRANIRFLFYGVGAAFDGKCVAEVPLPDYGVAAIRTGQARTVDGDQRWEAAFPYQDPAAYRAAYDAVASAEPDARAEFSIHMSEDEPALIYAREPCAPSDVENPFFIHVTPMRESDLPDERKQYGFDNWGFDFLLRGIVFDGKCIAQAPLPDYPIASLRTGQWIRGEGEVWEATLSFPQ